MRKLFIALNIPISLILVISLSVIFIYCFFDMKLCFGYFCVLSFAVVWITLFQSVASNGLWGMLDYRYWRCVLKRNNQCPDNDIKFYLYNHETGLKRKKINLKDPNSLYKHGWHPYKKNVLIIHGFNGTESKTPMTLIRNAYITRQDYNIFTIDWEVLTIFPCYLSALSNTRLVAQCTAKLYSVLTQNGAPAQKITCVGHSLGAHICGMISNYLDLPQHRIVGLDPARPVINKYADKYFRLTKDDAHIVQVIHTNAGILGEINQVGHVDFCVNGGKNQPGCKGNIIRRARCSHFQSACYYAQSVLDNTSFVGRPCTKACPKLLNTGIFNGPSVPMGEPTPDDSRGMYCVQVSHDRDCPYY